MQLRQTTVEDIDAAFEIIEQARARIADLGIDQWQLGYPDRAVIERDVACAKSFVVVDDDGAILGTAMLYEEGDPAYDTLIEGAWKTASTSDDPGYLVVHRVAVGSASAGRGVARYLLSEAERIAVERGFQSVRIDTHLGNVPMRGLLEKCGYSQCGVFLLANREEPTRERVAYEKIVA